MANITDQMKKKRLTEIEDRKIQILMETGKTNERYNKTISRLNSEYKLLDEEYYILKFEVIGSKHT